MQLYTALIGYTHSFSCYIQCTFVNESCAVLHYTPHCSTIYIGLYVLHPLVLCILYLTLLHSVHCAIQYIILQRHFDPYCAPNRHICFLLKADLSPLSLNLAPLHAEKSPNTLFLFFYFFWPYFFIFFLLSFPEGSGDDAPVTQMPPGKTSSLPPWKSCI